MTKLDPNFAGYIARDDLSMKVSSAETASTTGQAIDLGDKRTLDLTLDVTAVSGSSPTMTVVIEGSHDGLTWFTIATIGSNGVAVGQVVTAPSNITATGTQRFAIPAAQYVRYRSVIAGTTPSFTYSLGGTSV